MAKKVTLRVPRQKVAFDPWRTIKKIHWDSKGEWCSVGVFLGNEDDGGFASLALVGLKPGVDPFTIEIGTNGHGNSAFWNFREHDGAFVSEAHFKQNVTLSDGSKMRAYGVWGFDAGDSHNGATFYFKAPSADFDADCTAGGAGLHTAPFANIYRTKTFTRFEQESISVADGTGFDSASFHFNLTTKVVATTSP